MTRKKLDEHFRMVQQLHEAQELQRITLAKAENSNAELVIILKECLADINQCIAQCEERIAETSPDVEAFISSAKAPRVRQMLRLRYLHGLAWCEIPQYMGHGTTEAAVKSACYDFLRKHIQ